MGCRGGGEHDHDVQREPSAGGLAVAMNNIVGYYTTGTVSVVFAKLSGHSATCGIFGPRDKPAP